MRVHINDTPNSLCKEGWTVIDWNDLGNAECSRIYMDRLVDEQGVSLAEELSRIVFDYTERSIGGKECLSFFELERDSRFGGSPHLHISHTINRVGTKRI